MHKSRHIKKESLLSALEQSLGVVTVACKKAKIPRSTYYKWLNEDTEFATKVKELENVALDFAESQLHKQISENSTAATIFYLKTKGKKRGYIEKNELDITSGNEKIQMNKNINLLEKLSKEQLRELLEDE